MIAKVFKRAGSQGESLISRQGRAIKYSVSSREDIAGYYRRLQPSETCTDLNYPSSPFHGEKVASLEAGPNQPEMLNAGLANAYTASWASEALSAF